MTLLVKPQNGKSATPRFSNLIENFLENDFPVYFKNEWSKTVTPSANIRETKEGYAIELAVPGFNKENFNIKVEKDLLTVTGEVKNEQNEEHEGYTRREFSQSSFTRSFTLPDSVDSEKIGASYENGILKVNLPKREEAKGKGPIEIKVA